MTHKVGYFLKAHDGIYSAVRGGLPPSCELVTLADGRTPLEAVRDLDVLIAHRVTREMIDAAPRLRLIMTPGVGYDGVDLDAAEERGIPIATTVCGNTTEVAEFTLLLMLAVSRRLVELDAALRQGEWMMWARRLQCRNLSGRTLGLVGFGRIGQAVARRAAALEMEVQYYDAVTGPSGRRVPLDELLATSDIVSLHIPLSAETRNLMNAARLAQMKPGAILINAARGEVVDEAALLAALRSGHLAGAGLDVFSPEPPARDNPLFALPNVVVTPHIGSGTIDGLQLKVAQYGENIRRVFAGEDLIDALPVARRLTA